MSSPDSKLEEIKNELQWVNIRDDFSEGKANDIKMAYKILVPIGTLVTAGILGRGLFYMLKRNSRKQQLFMRYRVLSQGITVVIAALGILHVKLSS